MNLGSYDMKLKANISGLNQIISQLLGPSEDNYDDNDGDDDSDD